MLFLSSNFKANKGKNKIYFRVSKPLNDCQHLLLRTKYLFYFFYAVFAIIKNRIKNLFFIEVENKQKKMPHLLRNMASYATYKTLISAYKSFLLSLPIPHSSWLWNLAKGRHLWQQYLLICLFLSNQGQLSCPKLQH